MPYIRKSKRDALRKHESLPTNAGELNFVITTIIDKYLGTLFSYEKLNEIIGVLECTKAEFYRRVVVPYEEEKMKENGDVYIDRTEDKNG